MILQDLSQNGWIVHIVPQTHFFASDIFKWVKQYQCLLFLQEALRSTYDCKLFVTIHFCYNIQRMFCRISLECYLMPSGFCCALNITNWVHTVDRGQKALLLFYSRLLYYSSTLSVQMQEHCRLISVFYQVVNIKSFSHINLHHSKEEPTVEVVICVTNLAKACCTWLK